MYQYRYLQFVENIFNKKSTNSELLFFSRYALSFKKLKGFFKDSTPNCLLQTYFEAKLKQLYLKLCIFVFKIKYLNFLLKILNNN